MNGYSLTMGIHKDSALQYLYVVLRASRSWFFNESMIKHMGASSFLAKYEPDDLALLLQERLFAHRGELAAVSP